MERGVSRAFGNPQGKGCDPGPPRSAALRRGGGSANKPRQMSSFTANLSLHNCPRKSGLGFCFFFLLLTSLEQPFHPGWPRGGVGVPPWPLGVAEGTLALCRGDISRDVPMAPDTHPPPPGTNQARPCAGGKTPRNRVWGSDSASNKIPEFSRSSPQGGVGIALRAFPGGIWAGKRWAVLPWERA